jgi:plasmid stabilization system protein ParE
MILIITEPAELDMQDILSDGYKKYGETKAISYAKSIYDKLHLLQEFPNMGHVRNDIPFGYKAIQVEKEHIAVYRVDGQIIYILRILYSGFDFTRHKIQ